MNTKTIKLWWRDNRRALRWILTIVVLYFVIKEIDFIQLKHNFVKTNPALFFLGLSLSPFLVIIGAFRWRSLLTVGLKRKIPLSFIFQHYWTGLALGFFVPASLGWDAYRIYTGGRHFGNYTMNLAIIFIEKIAALVTCMSIIVILYPLTTIVVHPTIEKIFYLANILLVAALLFIAGIFTLLRSRSLSQVVRKVEIYSAKILEKISARLKIKNKVTAPTSIQDIIEPFFKPKIILVIILSFGIQLVSAIKSQIFFNALGYPLPFIVNLFLAPTLYFIFLLPISFGSLGIREGVYIILYGLFGVPAEIALLVSFFNLFGMLLNSATGGLVMLFAGEYKSIRAAK